MENIAPLQIKNPELPLRRVFVKDLLLDAEIGVWSFEKGKTQQIRLNLDLYVHEDTSYHQDNIDNVVCYNSVVNKIIKLLDKGHVALVETFAENVATLCLEDKRIETARVMVEKLEAIDQASSVGVEITRTQNG